jgi:hypothetical protein
MPWGFGKSRSITVDAVWLEGDQRVAAVGEASYQDALCSICQSSTWEDVRFECMAYLLPEPDNQYDANAIKVMVEGQHVGYLSRGDAIDYGTAVRAMFTRGKAIACDAMIAGRGPGSDTSNVGIFLHLPTPGETLRLVSPPPPPPPPP